MAENASKTPGSPAVALLVDVDNIHIGLQSTRSQPVSASLIASALKDFAEQSGPLAVAKAYGTARGKFDPTKDFAAAGYEVFAGESSRGASAATTDIRMSMDGQELLFIRPDIGIMIIASGDSDFLALANAVKQRGKKVVVIAPKLVTSTLLRDAAHLFVEMEDCLAKAEAQTGKEAIVVPAKERKRQPEPPKRQTPQPAQMLKVFMCHSRHDQASVRELYNRLKGEYGIKPWLDKEDLLGGQDWEREIELAVRSSHAVVACLSKRAMDGAGFVHKEIKLALDVADRQPEGTVFIIPLRLEDCAIPERLSRYHALDLFEAGGYAAVMRTLEARAAAIR